MKHKSRLFSVAALGAAAALVIGSTVYRAKADDVVVPADPATAVGTGYAGGEVAEVTGLTTQSYGTFNYDAGEGGDNITIASSDISNLARATKALSTQMVALGDAAKLADDETKAAVNDKMVAVDASLNSISNTLSTLQDRMTTFESNYAPSVARCYSMFNLNAPSGLTVTPETNWQNAQPDANYNATTGVVKVGTIFKKTNTVPTLTLGNMGRVVKTVTKSPTGNPENIDLTKYHYTGQATETRTYTLDGWYTAASGGTKVYEPNATYTQTIDEDNFYAHYNATVSYKYLSAPNDIKTTARKSVGSIYSGRYNYAYVNPNNYKKIVAQTLTQASDRHRTTNGDVSLSYVGLDTNKEYVLSTEKITEENCANCAGRAVSQALNNFYIRYREEGDTIATGVTGNNTYYDVNNTIYSVAGIEIYGSTEGFHTVGEREFYFYPVTRWE